MKFWLKQDFSENPVKTSEDIYKKNSCFKVILAKLKKKEHLNMDILRHLNKFN